MPASGEVSPYPCLDIVLATLFYGFMAPCVMNDTSCLACLHASFSMRAPAASYVEHKDACVPSTFFCWLAPFGGPCLMPCALYPWPHASWLLSKPFASTSSPDSYTTCATCMHSAWCTCAKRIVLVRQYCRVCGAALSDTACHSMTVWPSPNVVCPGFCLRVCLFAEAFHLCL